LLTSTVAAERRPTLIALVRAYLAQTQSRARAGVVHRLDRDAAGLLVFSKNHAAYRNLKEQFFRHSVERVYHAVVQGIVPKAPGRIETTLVEWADGSVHSTHQRDKGQRAITQYQVVRQGGGCTLLCVRLLTGRKHQIRAHLSERGWPIVGDTVYGDKDKTLDSPLMLVASKLAFDHPRSRKRLEFALPLPPEMERLVP
jgi:RluA family pseudouridine synthase